jgi:proline iminopeptidase
MKKLFFNILIISSILLIYSCGNSSETSSDGGDENRQEIPVEITDETVNINGVDHFIKKMGKGEPIIVLHGGPGLFHDYLVPHFKKLAADYQIIFYDQRGCGKTPFPSDTSSIKLESYIDDLEGIRKHLKIEKLNLLGHSWGGILAVSYGKKYPNNLSKIILVSPGPATSEYFDETFNNMQAKRSDEDTKALIQSMMSKEFEKRDPKIFKRTVELNDKVNLVDQESVDELYEPITFNKENANNLLLVSSMMEKNFFDYDLTDGIDVIKCPTLVIIGDLDNVPFSSAQLITESIEKAQLEVIKKCCHYPFFESPKEFNKIVRGFLKAEKDS